MQITVSYDNGSGSISLPDSLVVTSEQVVGSESSVAVWLTNGCRCDGDRARAGRSTVGRVSHGTIHLPSSRRHSLTASGVRETARVLGLDTLRNSCGPTP